MNHIFVAGYNKQRMSPGAAQTLTVLIDVAFWSSLVPVGIGALRFKQCSYGLRCLILLAVVAFSADVLTELYRESHAFSAYVPRVYTILEFTLISTFFVGEIRRLKIQVAIIAVNVLFIGVVVTDIILQGAMQMDNFSIGIAAVIFLLYSIVMLYTMMKDMVYANITATPQFWIITGIMIYFGGDIFIFVSSNYLITNSMDLMEILWWGVHSVLVILLNLLIGIGLWKARKQFQ